MLIQPDHGLGNLPSFCLRIRNLVCTQHTHRDTVGHHICEDHPVLFDDSTQSHRVTHIFTLKNNPVSGCTPSKLSSHCFCAIPGMRHSATPCHLFCLYSSLGCVRPTDARTIRRAKESCSTPFPRVQKQPQRHAKSSGAQGVLHDLTSFEG